MRGEKPEQRPLLDEDIEDQNYSGYNKTEYNYCEVTWRNFTARVDSPRNCVLFFHTLREKRMINVAKHYDYFRRKSYLPFKQNSSSWNMHIVIIIITSLKKEKNNFPDYNYFTAQ